MIFLSEENKGGNSKLINKSFNLPYGLLSNLKKILNDYKNYSNHEYYDHLKNITINEKIPYGDMKKIKSFFENYTGDKNNIDYILNGGDELKMWVNLTLDSAVNNIKNIKYAQKKSGINNAFIKPHTKNRNTKNSTKVTFSKPNVDGSITQNTYDGKSYKFSEKKVVILKKDQLKMFD